MLIYFMCFILFSIGLYCALRKRNIIKIIMGIMIAEYAVNLFLILVGYRMEGRSPIFAPNQEILNMVDPLPQALVLTAIVISLGVLAMMVAICIRLYERYGTFDITEMRRLKG